MSFENKKIDSLIRAVELIAFSKTILWLLLTLSSNVKTSLQVYSSFVSLSIVIDELGPIHSLNPFIKL